MKKVTVVLLALAFAMFVAAPASFGSDITMEISINGGAFAPLCTGTGSCSFTYSSGGLAITSGSGVNNVPGTPNLAFTSTSNLNITYTGGAPLTFAIRDTSGAFTSPSTNPLVLFVHEATTPQPGSSFNFQTTGSLVGAPGCSTNTANLAISGTSDGSDSTIGCTNTGAFSLISLATFTNVQSGSAFDAVTRVSASAVPEPTSMMLFGSGLLGFAGMIRRKLNK